MSASSNSSVITDQKRKRMSDSRSAWIRLFLPIVRAECQTLAGNILLRGRLSVAVTTRRLCRPERNCLLSCGNQPYDRRRSGSRFW